MGLYDYTIYSILRRNVRVFGNRIALKFGEEGISYNEFCEKVDRLACGLLEVGLQKGDRIGVIAQNCLEYIYLYLAAAKIGAIMLPVNWRLKAQEIEYILRDATPKIVFIGPEYQDMLNQMIPGIDFVERHYAIGRSGENFASFNELMENSMVCPLLPVHSDDAYVIIYTAAVGGRPRGATLTHRGLVVSNLQAMYYFQLTERDCNLSMLPLFHLAGLGAFLNVMQAGGLNIILEKFDVNIALKHIEQDKVTIFGEFPPMLTSLLDSVKDSSCELSSLRAVFGIDHPDTIKRFEDMTGATFWTAFGQSETSGFVSFSPYFERPGSVGLPSCFADVEVMDDCGNIMDTKGVGEIVVRGPLVFKGYWNLDKDNEYTFRDGWHHTGDMGYFDIDGYLWYAGRMAEKELIKPGGENVYPVEVEDVILLHPAVEEVSVIGVPDKEWGEAIKAICVLKKDMLISETEMIDFVASRIARYKKPKYVVFVLNLPKTEEGNIDRGVVKIEHGKSGI